MNTFEEYCGFLDICTRLHILKEFLNFDRALGISYDGFGIVALGNWEWVLANQPGRNTLHRSAAMFGVGADSHDRFLF